jgi:N-methylhydantoinase A
LRHEGQATELTVPLTPGRDAQQLMRERFLAEYLKTYGYRDETAIELVKVRLIGRGLRARRLDFAAMSVTERPAARSTGSRAVSFGRGQAFIETPILARRSIGRGARPGPLIVDEFDATIVVPPDASVCRDEIGNIVMEIGGVP